MPEIDLSRRLVYRRDRLIDPSVRRGIRYRPLDAPDLKMDVYTPPGAQSVPAVLFIHGGPIPREMTPPTEWGSFISYGELAAACGLAGIVPNHRLYGLTDYPIAQDDVETAIAYVRANAGELGVDGDRLAVWVFSGGGPLLARFVRNCPAFVRCLVAFYAILDLRHVIPPGADAAQVAGMELFSPAAQLPGSLTRVPVLVARAGLDAPAVNDSIDSFVRSALSGNAMIECLNHPAGQHAFDVLDDDGRSREIIERAMEFIRSHVETGSAELSVSNR
jgi:acetyl esterase/lipase